MLANQAPSILRCPLNSLLEGVIFCVNISLSEEHNTNRGQFTIDKVTMTMMMMIMMMILLMEMELVLLFGDADVDPTS